MVVRTPSVSRHIFTVTTNRSHIMGSGADHNTFVCYCRGEGYSPGVQFLNPLSSVARVLQGACAHMRRHASHHSAARLCGFLHTLFPGRLGIVLEPPPAILESGIPDWKNYPPSDVFGDLYLIDVDIAVAVCLRGYARKGRLIRLRTLEPEGISYGGTCEKYLAEAKKEHDQLRRKEGLPLLTTPNVLKGKELYSTK